MQGHTWRSSIKFTPEYSCFSCTDKSLWRPHRYAYRHYNFMCHHYRGATCSALGLSVSATLGQAQLSTTERCETAVSSLHLWPLSHDARQGPKTLLLPSFLLEDSWDKELHELCKSLGDWLSFRKQRSISSKLFICTTAEEEEDLPQMPSYLCSLLTVLLYLICHP